MQHVTVIIARKHLYCITMGWSWLLLVKRKRTTTTTTTNNNNNKGFRSWLEATHADDVVHMDDTFRIINYLCEDVSPVSCTCIMELFAVYIKFLRCRSGNLLPFWMSYMDLILDVVDGFDRDFAGPHPIIQRGGLDATPVRAMIPWCFAYYYELCTLSPIL